MTMGSANERRRYNVVLSLIGWAHTHIDPCIILAKSIITMKLDIVFYILSLQ